MAQFDFETLASLKKLCRIECTLSEEEDILRSLQKVLDYVHLLSEVDTASVPSCNFVLANMLKNAVRGDTVQDLLARDSFLLNAPDQISGLIRIPPVMKE